MIQLVTSNSVPTFGRSLSPHLVVNLRCQLPGGSEDEACGRLQRRARIVAESSVDDLREDRKEESGGLA